MRKTILLVLLATLICGGNAQEKKEPVFTVIKQNPITSVKNQNRSGTCWCFSSLSFLEAELLRAGKGDYDLCESFVLHHTYQDRAVASVRMHGDVSFAQGGSFYDVLYCMKHYGLAPEEAMPLPGKLQGDSLFNFNECFGVLEPVVNSIAKGTQKVLTPIWKNSVVGILDAYLGKLPDNFEYKEKVYTPVSFAKSLGLDADDYISLTSFTHHPFYEPFIIEVQDNWRWSSSYNLPLNEFMEVMDSAVRAGYCFAWGADVSEKGFNRNGIATVPWSAKVMDMTGSDAAKWTGSDKVNRPQEKETSDELDITQEIRQKAYDNWETTDDHGMVVYGLAKDESGKEYFIVKNSWGDYNQYHGSFYASKAYVAYKTMNIIVNKKALPKAIAKKLGIA